MNVGNKHLFILKLGDLSCMRVFMNVSGGGNIKCALCSSIWLSEPLKLFNKVIEE